MRVKTMRQETERWVLSVLMTLCVITSHVLGCPMAGCDCQTDQTGIKNIIYCKGKALTDIPTVVPSNETYHELTLADNSISYIPESAFKGLIVKKIDLQGNPIINISAAAFDGVESTLETLILHGDQNNRVLPAPWRALNNLTGLTHLQLSHFDIGSIDDSSVLSTLTNLQTLEITSCQLHTLHQDMLQPVRQSLSTLDLSYNQFLSIPTEAIRGLGALNKLILQSNSISQVDANSFSTNTQLEELEMAQNRIIVLENGCFNGITNSLYFLGLSLNKLPGDQLVAIESLTRLQQINLAYNPLVTIPPRTFRNLQNMAFLNLRSCQLERLNINMLEGLGPAMVLLILSENHFLSIDTGVFVQMTELQQLEMDNQNINLTSSIVPGFFRGLDQLRSLRLENTGFRTASNWQAISSLKTLTTLTLSNNNIKQIPELVFANMPQLNKLYLQDNSLTNVTRETFHGLNGSLDTLDLQNNQISTIDQCSFFNFNKLKPTSVNLNSNPLACDCELEWISEWIQSDNTPFKNFLIQWACSNGDKIINMQPEDFGCPENTTRPGCENIYNTTTTEPPTTTEPQTTEPITTTSTTPTTTTTRPDVDLLFNVTGVTVSTISLSWEISHPSYVDYYLIQYEDLSTSERRSTPVIYRTTTKYTLESLEPRRAYEVCIFVQFTTASFKETKCLSRSTAKPAASPDPESQNSEEIGIIAGSVAGGVVLLIVLAVIIFILVKHRRQENVYDKPTEPTPWQRAGKPHEAYDSKRFTKQKKTGNEHHIKEIRHVQGNNNLQRQSAGSYQYLDRDVHQLPPPGNDIHMTNSFNHPKSNGVNTSDLNHKYYEIDLDGVDTHI